MGIRKDVDWDRVERQYRAGQLSIREIARQHNITDGAVRKRAKEGNWPRDLSHVVRSEVRTQLSCEPVPSDLENPEIRDIVSSAAAQGVEVVRQHRATIAKNFALVRTVQQQLEQALCSSADDVNIFVSKSDGVSTMLNALSHATQRMVVLERQAFALDETPDEARPDILDRPMSEEEWREQFAK